MYKTDFKNLDGHLLHLFVLISETSSVSRAAAHLGINQSSASHGLERLRHIIDDPLFVRSGRKIVPTERAIQLAEKARTLLAGLEEFTQSDYYDPKAEEGAFRIAANDYEVETALRPLLPQIRLQAPNARIHIVRSYNRKDWIPSLRANDVDLVLAPNPQGKQTDLVQQTLFQDSHVCLYDPDKRKAPTTIESYCDASHAIMMAGNAHRTELDGKLRALGRERKIVLVSPSFSMLAGMIRGTDIIATMPSRLTKNLFSAFASVEPPLKTEQFSIAQVWHIRDTTSPRHQWLRELVRSSVLTAMS